MYSDTTCALHIFSTPQHSGVTGTANTHQHIISRVYSMQIITDPLFWVLFPHAFPGETAVACKEWSGGGRRKAKKSPSVLWSKRPSKVVHCIGQFVHCSYLLEKWTKHCVVTASPLIKIRNKHSLKAGSGKLPSAGQLCNQAGWRRMVPLKYYAKISFLLREET